MIPNPNEKTILAAYAEAKERYRSLGVDTDEAIKRLQTIPISMHCWQGDDVGGFESDAKLDGGIAVTGNYPGKARTSDELRADLEAAFKLLPGRHRLNIHAIYGEFGGKKVGRDEITVENFKGWIDWAKENVQGLDFNPTCFSDPKAADGFTLSHHDAGIRTYWIDHCKACREIGDAMGAALGNPTVVNIWLPDGMKDVPADRLSPRQRLLESLDAVIETRMENMLDAVECKLFGIGSESYVVGSHEFYMGYAVSRGTLLCLDAGHFHPTEVISDKISSVLTYIDEILLHVSRGVRWDSDHVVLLSDELRAIAGEIVRGNFVERVHIGLDYFDASINRVAAWTIGTRAMIQALLIALLEPKEKLQALELDGDYTARLALMEATKSLPFGAVWDQYCYANNVPIGISFINEIRAYEKDVLSTR